MDALWQVRSLPNPPSDYVKAVGGHPLVAQLLYARGYHTLESARAFLDADVYVPASPFELPQMHRAVERIAVVLQAPVQRIGIWGDFDVDGQTSVVLLMQGLRRLGADDLVYHVPLRSEEGHGMQPDAVRRFIQDSQPALILTCDTGIAEHAGIGAAVSAGVDVIVTDHHQLPEVLPNAYACVNPQMLPLGHPLRTLPGVGTAYMLLLALAQHLDAAVDLADLLDLVALGIVADVAEQVGDTRYLLQRGLSILRGTTRRGLVELASTARFNLAQADESTIGFEIGPRLNALGRLGDASDGVRLLISDDLVEVRLLAQRVELLNSERKVLTQQVFDGAVAMITREPEILHHAALVLGHPEWHSGVLGIVATRLVEQYGRPVLLLRYQDDTAVGSARSVSGVDITRAIASCSQYTHSYGGHTMAAGVSLAVEHIDALRRILSNQVQAQLGGYDTVEAVGPLVDAVIDPEDVNETLAQQIARLGPFGSGNPMPLLLLTGMVIARSRALGREGRHTALRLRAADGVEVKLEFVWWRGMAQMTALRDYRLDITFTLERGQYRGKQQIQGVIHAVRRGQQRADHVDMHAIQWIDYRHVVDPHAALNVVLSSETSIVVWNEGLVLDVPSVRRTDLYEASVLVVWTCPASPAVLRDALFNIKPQKVVLFAETPLPSEVDKLVRSCAGLAKHALNVYDGRLDLRRGAGALGVTEGIIQRGVKLASIRFQVFRVVKSQPNKHAILLQWGRGGASDKETILWEQLSAAIDEMHAYHRFYKRSAAQSLLVTDETSG